MQSSFETRATPSLRLFHVRMSDGPSGRGHVITGASEAHEAALLFAERWLLDAEGSELRVLVHDDLTGEQSCFTIDLDVGAARPC